GGGIFLGAQHGHIVFADSTLQPRQPLLKKAGRRDAVIENMPFVIVELISLRAPAQLPPEIDITNTRVLNGRLQGVTIKLRGIFGVRLRARVYNYLDSLRLQQAEEVFHSMIGMSDGKDMGAGRGVFSRLWRHARAGQFNTGTRWASSRPSGIPIAESRSLPAPADGLPQGGTVQVFAQVHQGKEGVQDTRLHFVGQVQAAGRSPRQHFSMSGDVLYDFDLAPARGLSVDGLPAHLGAV